MVNIASPLLKERLKIAREFIRGVGNPIPAARATEFLRRGTIEASGALGESDSPTLNPTDIEEPAQACNYGAASG